jgi:hypothetical protein
MDYKRQIRVLSKIRSFIYVLFERELQNIVSLYKKNSSNIRSRWVYPDIACVFSFWFHRIHFSLRLSHAWSMRFYYFNDHTRVVFFHYYYLMSCAALRWSFSRVPWHFGHVVHRIIQSILTEIYTSSCRARFMRTFLQPEKGEKNSAARECNSLNESWNYIEAKAKITLFQSARTGSRACWLLSEIILEEIKVLEWFFFEWVFDVNFVTSYFILATERSFLLHWLICTFLYFLDNIAHYIYFCASNETNIFHY